MRNRIQPWFAVVLVFMAIGIAARLFQGSIDTWLIPLTLVAIVFLLYKLPPTKWRSPANRGRAPFRGKRQDAARASVKLDKRRTSPFTVIEGRKNKDDEPPRYH